MFCLLVDDFGIEYVGERHALHLKSVLAKHYDITVNWKGDLYSGINLEWNYNPVHTKRTVHLTMDDYISNLKVKFNHADPNKTSTLPIQTRSNNLRRQNPVRRRG